MLKLLKLFGFDAAASLSSIKERLDLRLEEVGDSARRMIRDAAVISALLAAAWLAAAMAAVVGLIALYLWSSEAIGPYGGLATVGGVLVLVSIAFFSGAEVKIQSLKPKRPQQSSAAHGGSGDAATGEKGASSTAGSIAPPAIAYQGAADNKLRQPFAFLLSEVIGERQPGTLTDLLAQPSLGADETVARAADIVEHGDRGQTVFVLAGAALLGWLLTRYPAVERSR
ncbi:hypothetical protein [Methylocapsa acidiphila]|uniref:hypothetical protein n=1 Tax=Methylocapsa acidiphila TaxID=133552 RepID=UPI000416AA3C|nr:hypothetical protein [Methylocapsa acidiphila]